MLLQEVVSKLNLTVHSGHEKMATEVNYGYASDILSDVMAKSPKYALWITNQTHENILALVFFKGLAGVVLPEGLMPDEEILAKAKDKKIPVFSSKESAFDIIGQLYGLGIRGHHAETV